MFTDIPEEIAADPWFKVVDMLQQNWAVIVRDDQGVLIVFYGDTRGVFDEIRCESVKEAYRALQRNGFQMYLNNKRAAEFMGIPQGKFHIREHPNGRIYSSGRFWR